MYKKDFVMAVKVNGKVLREFDDLVYLPFGAEYTILLKNLSNRKARVSVTIDGSDILGNNYLIIDAKKDIELKRFINNNNLHSGNALKFIEKTEKISNYRGDKAEDGLLTIIYEFEKERQQYLTHLGTPQPWKYYDHYTSRKTTTTDWESIDWSKLGGSYTVSTVKSQHSPPMVLSSMTSGIYPDMRHYDPKVRELYSSDVGITVPGSVNDQKFTVVNNFVGDGMKYTMTVKMCGEVETRKVFYIDSSDIGKEDAGKFLESVKEEITVRKLEYCGTCGTKVKQLDKFCRECGASLTIV